MICETTTSAQNNTVILCYICVHVISFLVSIMLYKIIRPIL